MNKYYLIRSLSQNCKFVIKKRWYHKYIGRPLTTVDKCKANTKKEAEALFRKHGHAFGLLNRATK